MSFLQDEIRQQPQVLVTLLDEEMENARRIAADLRARGVKYVIIAARGTSDNAARYGQYPWAHTTVCRWGWPRHRCSASTASRLDWKTVLSSASLRPVA